MTTRPDQPEPFLRGTIFPPTADVAYPRANPADAEHLPIDVWAAAQLPVGVRLEFVGDAELVRIEYRTATANLGYRGDGAGATFVAYRSGRKVAEVEAMLGDGVVELELYGDPDRPTVVYLPEGMRPTVHSVEALGGSIAPAPVQPRWLCYGDATAQGWLASSPAMSWPSVVSRKLGLDLVNLGYAGATRVETTSAMSLADTPGEVISVAFGSNGWKRIPHSPGLMAEEARSFLGLIRDTRPSVPIIVLSPTVRPDAEDEPNRLGATLADLRFALEDVVHSLSQAGDANLYLVEGAKVLGEEDLADGVYPGDEGHKRLAAAVGKHLSPLMATLRQEALARRQEDVVRSVPALRLVKTEIEDDPVPSEVAGHRADRADADGRVRPRAVTDDGGVADDVEETAVATSPVAALSSEAPSEDEQEPGSGGRVVVFIGAPSVPSDETDETGDIAHGEVAAAAVAAGGSGEPAVEMAAPGPPPDPNAQAVLDSILALAVTPQGVEASPEIPAAATEAPPAAAPAAETPEVPLVAAAAETPEVPLVAAAAETPEVPLVAAAASAAEVPLVAAQELPAAASPVVEVVTPVPVEVVPDVPVEVVPLSASAVPVEAPAPEAPAPAVAPAPAAAAVVGPPPLAPPPAAEVVAPAAQARQPAVAQEYVQAVAFLNEQRGQL